MILSSCKVNEDYDMFIGSVLTNVLHDGIGLANGSKVFTKTIGETVAMSGDKNLL